MQVSPPLWGFMQTHLSVMPVSLCQTLVLSSLRAFTQKYLSVMSVSLCWPAGVISSVGLHTDTEFKAFTPADGYNKNVTYKNGECSV